MTVTDARTDAAFDETRDADGTPPSGADPSGKVRDAVLVVCGQAKVAARALATASRTAKDAALESIALALVANAERILAANAEDLARGERDGMSVSLLDRLRLDTARIAAIAAAVRHVAGLPDPVGEIVRGSRLPNGLRLSQVRVPMGVIGMIYEARPNVTVDAAALALKSGNAAVLRGGSAAEATNVVLVDVMREAVAATGLPADSISSIDAWGREGVLHLMRARGVVDLVIPRGGAGLIKTVVENSTVPVIETGIGNCHVFVDASADLEQALAVAFNAKVQRPSVCNAAETLLVHASVAKEFLPGALAAFHEAGVRLHVDDRTAELAGELPVEPVTDEAWAAEFHGLELAVGVVDGLDEAIAHIQRWSTGHSEAILTTDTRSADRFVAEVDSAAVMVNASTRFTDGGEFGFGAEIGISTQKLHARGPMGLPELTSTKWVVVGDGHVRG